MSKHKNKLITAAVILFLLIAAWFYGGNYPDSGKVPSAVEAMAPEPATNTTTTTEAVKSSEQQVTAPSSSELTSTVPSSTEPSSTESLSSDQSATGMDIDPETGKDRYLTDPVPEGRPIPVEPQDVAVGDGSFTVKLTVRCDTILDNMNLLNKEKYELIPADGVIFPETDVTVYEGESVFNILHREMKQARIHMSFRHTPIYNSAYIEAINNLYEYDVGELSGWMYKVNGWFPNYGCSRYQLAPGDVVEWHYTCELGRDLGEFWIASGYKEDK